MSCLRVSTFEDKPLLMLIGLGIDSLICLHLFDNIVTLSVNKSFSPCLLALSEGIGVSLSTFIYGKDVIMAVFPRLRLPFTIVLGTSFGRGKFSLGNTHCDVHFGVVHRACEVGRISVTVEVDGLIGVFITPKVY